VRKVWVWNFRGLFWVEFSRAFTLRPSTTSFFHMFALTELSEAQTLGTDPTLHGLWLVTTPTSSLRVGDLVRVFWQEPPVAQGYLMRRATSRTPLPVRAEADALARKRKIITALPLAHLFAIHIPPMLTFGHDMEPFLVRAPHLVPGQGWMHLFTAAGVTTLFTPPRSWQFHATCWHDSPLTGKTGGLHMSLHENTRRCQLLVEYGVCGDSLVGTLPHTKQGVLMYVSTMNAEAAARSGEVCHESALSLSFSALLLAYVETLSLVRRAVFEHPLHPYGGVDYHAREWDYTHTPYTKPFPVACLDDRPARTINIAEFAKKKAEVWLRAEVAANPMAWTHPLPPLGPKDVRLGMKVPIHVKSRGVDMWVEACVTNVDPVEFDIPSASTCFGVVDSQVVFVQ